MLGERWTLLIVRRLLSGPKRFGELQRLVVGITPKWLTARLRALETAGHDWRWLAGGTAGDVVVTTTARHWATLVFKLQAGHDSAAESFTVTGDPDRVREFKALRVFADARLPQYRVE